MAIDFVCAAKAWIALKVAVDVAQRKALAGTGLKMGRLALQLFKKSMVHDGEMILY